MATPLALSLWGAAATPNSSAQVTSGLVLWTGLTNQVTEASSRDVLVLLWVQLPGLSSASYRSTPDTNASTLFFL